MTSPEGHDANHPLAKPNLPLLKDLQAQGQTVGSRGYHMQITNFFHWGFLIYRCDYSDDDLFHRFVAYLREEAERYHQLAKQDRTTGLYLCWTIIEDREGLDGATKGEVRERFVEWRDGLSVERDGEGADHRVTRFLPRFEYCIHIGKDSLDILRAYEKATASASAPASGQQMSASPPVFFALVRAEQKLGGLPEGNEPDEDDEYDQGLENVMPDVEGSTEYDVGWMYVKAKDWVSVYEELHDDQGWHFLYTRPPAIARG